VNDSRTSSTDIRLVDTHCHLDDPSFDEDLDAVLQASREAGVTSWIMVGFSPERWDAAIRMAHEIDGLAHMLGVHPANAQEWNADTSARLVHLLESSHARAVGEIGLDFYRDNAPYEVQHRAFIDQLRIARDLGLPAVFHMRDAEDEMLKILESESDLPRMVFHSFDGSERLPRFILDRDAIIGVGGLATRQKSGQLREQLCHIPLRSMVIETDSPWLIPARQKTRRNTPAQVRTIATFLADHLGCTLQDVARETTATAESVFGRLLP